MIFFRRIFFFLFFVSFLVGAQAQSFKQYVNKADKYFEKGDYYNAIEYYLVAFRMDSAQTSLNYKVAETYRLVNDYKHSERFYYKTWVRDSKNEYPQSLYWLGMMQKSNGRYKDAVKSFDRYYRRFSRDSSNYFTKKSVLEKEACEWAQDQAAKPLKVQIFHLDSNINSIHSEFAPVLKDTSELFFTSLRGDSASTIYTGEVYSKLFRSTGHDSVWTTSTIADSILNHFPEHSGNMSFNKDFTKAVFTLSAKKKSKKMPSGICESKIQNNKFSPPQPLDADINLPGSINTQPCLGTDTLGNEILFFASDRPGGFGKFDIWYCKANKEGRFGKPINAGRFINTPDDEVCPFYDRERQLLFFSSTYHKGMGGFDIFYSHWTDSLLAYGTPVNRGYPLNTAANDLYYFQTSDTLKGFFTSNRIGSFSVHGETCCNDIFAFELPPAPKAALPRDTIEPIVISRVVIEAEHKQEIIDKIKLLVPLTLYFDNDRPDPKTTLTTSKKNYEATYNEYLATKQKYKTEYSAGLKGADKEKAEKDIEDFFNNNLVSGFEGLEKFAALMLENLEEGRLVTMTLKGYCSSLASTDYNKNLAKRRIACLKNYFFEYGNGVFLEYMSAVPPPPGTKKGRIEIIEEDVGKTDANEASDNVHDQRNSVYSKKAAMERNIQIIAISAADGK